MALPGGARLSLCAALVLAAVVAQLTVAGTGTEPEPEPEPEPKVKVTRPAPAPRPSQRPLSRPSGDLGAGGEGPSSGLNRPRRGGGRVRKWPVSFLLLSPVAVRATGGH